MDNRYFKDPIKRKKRRYIPNPEAQLLGETQWRWLDNILHHSDASAFVIGNGTQVLPDEHPFEKWANFPRDRNRLLKVIKHIRQPVILLSGDRYLGEIMILKMEAKHPLLEITSSSLTHTLTGGSEPNRFRQGPLASENNFGFLQMVFTKNELRITAELRCNDNVVASIIDQIYPLGKTSE